jgi:hypothetical protein
MNYGFWLLVGQGAQIGLARAQLQVQHGILNHLAQQQMAQQQQAALAQLTFDLQQLGPRLRGLATQDPFSAWILANMRVRLLNGVDVRAFHRLEDKNAFAGAMDGLAAIAPHVPSGADGHMAIAVLDAVVAATNWYQALGPDPVGEMSRRRVAHEGARRNQIILAIGLFLSVVLIAIVWPVGILLFVGLLIGLISVSTGASRKAADRKNYERHFVVFEQFSRDPRGGLLVSDAMQRFPALARG